MTFAGQGAWKEMWFGKGGSMSHKLGKFCDPKMQIGFFTAECFWYLIKKETIAKANFPRNNFVTYKCSAKYSMGNY